MLTITENANMKAGEIKHVFEVAGLGAAPYTFLRAETKTYQAAPGAPVQPGSSCDYCGTAITIEFWVRSADGRVFKTGCDCIRKTCADSNDPHTRSFLRAVTAAEKARTKAKAAAKVKSTVADLEALASDPAVGDQLAALPHPMGWAGKSRLDWAAFMRKNAGHTGRTQVLRFVQRMLAGKLTDAERGVAGASN